MTSPIMASTATTATSSPDIVSQVPLREAAVVIVCVMGGDGGGSSWCANTSGRICGSYDGSGMIQRK